MIEHQFLKKLSYIYPFLHKKGKTKHEILQYQNETMFLIDIEYEVEKNMKWKRFLAKLMLL